MPDSMNLTTLNRERCGCLRSKDMFVEVDGEPHILNSGSGIYWCVHTQNCLGPDGQVAEPEGCKPGRSCYEPL